MPLLICRLCLRFTEYFSSINLYCSASSINNLNLSEGLADLLPNLDLTLTTYPVICINCINLVTASYNFKKLCMENEKQIRDYYKKNKNTVDLHTLVESQHSCDTIPNLPNNFKYPCDMIKIEEPELPFFEEQSFSNKTSLNVLKICKGLKTTQNMSNTEKTGHITGISELEENHVIDVEILKSDIGSDAGLSLSGNEELPLVYCNKFSSKYSSKPNSQVTEQVNIDLSHKSLKSDTYKKSSKATNKKNTEGALYRKIDKRFSCLLCEKSFTQKLHVNGHLLTKHKTIPNIEERIESKIHYCKYCSYRTINNYNLDKHLVKIHNKKGQNKQKVGKFYCPDCQYSAETKQKITTHLKRYQTFPCCFCKNTYSWQSNLEEHILLNHAEEVFSKHTDLI